MTNKPRAFVIMPFDEEFDSVYDRFIKPVFEEVGFSVARADNIESQQNILRDIIERINNSNIIVADLTTINPNVFYEFGLAHAFKKPVIIITQSIDEVPFDLRSQRLLEYSVHFAEIDNAIDKLKRYALGAFKGTLQFGSPVTDFLPDVVGSNQADNTASITTVDEGELGFFDHLIAITEGYETITEITKGVHNDFQELTQSTENVSTELDKISSSPGASSPAAARRVLRQFAKLIGRFASRLKQANTEYDRIARETEDSLEFVVSFQRQHSEVANPQIDEQLSTLRELQSSLISGRNAVLEVAKLMDGLPQVERRLNREVARARQEIRAMASILDIILASISRALRVLTQ